MNGTPAASRTDATRTLTAAQSDFMCRLALELGMPVSEGPRLAAPHHVVGPSGLAGRLELHPEHAAVRVQTLLPMAPGEFIGQEVELLLAVQGELLTTLGWYLGTSTEGLLQLDSMTWLEDPVEAAQALDLANGVGIAVLRALLLVDAAPADRAAPNGPSNSKP